jgi:hypothetical protein
MSKNIKMLKDFCVAPDGFTVEKWKNGELKQNVPDELADELLHSSTIAAVEVTGDARIDARAEAEAKEAALNLAAERAVAAAALAAPTAPNPPKA